MDPNANVREMRQICRAVNDGQEHPDEMLASAGERLAELFDALDSWLLNGGFLPSEWRDQR